MAPTTCKGFSAASAARNFAPAGLDAAVGEAMRPAILAGHCANPSGSASAPADPHHRPADDLSVQVSLERAGKLGERNGARDDAIEMSGSEIPGNALPHFEALGPGRRR